VIFDFTGSTKPVSVGMVMACLDQRFDLEYLSQMRETPAAITAPYQRWGWGLLPFQKGDPGAIAGQLPIIIHTDAASILDNVQS
ncbi:MAG TPA: hypothetical protein PKY30_15110, partial [Myxococcota bacterium]|nr:hypothetical protein [Myxococcota bacterium]